MANLSIVKAHPKYKGMYFFKKADGDWSEDFYNLQRANDYALVEVEYVEVKE